MKHVCPQRQQSQNKTKFLKSYILTLQGHVVSVKCEERIDDLTVQVWWLSKRDRITNRQKDRQMDNSISTRCPKWTFQAGGGGGGIKINIHMYMFIKYFENMEIMHSNRSASYLLTYLLAKPKDSHSLNFCLLLFFHPYLPETLLSVVDCHFSGCL